MVNRFSQFATARKYGYRSGLELKVSDYLKELKIDFLYEQVKIEWEDLAYRTYTPDFVLSDGIIIETKGMFTAADRRKHLAIKKQHPELDIRFVFENSRRKLRKGAKSSFSTALSTIDSFHFCAFEGYKLGVLILPLFF